MWQSVWMFINSNYGKLYNYGLYISSLLKVIFRLIILLILKIHVNSYWPIRNNKTQVWKVCFLLCLFRNKTFYLNTWQISRCILITFLFSYNFRKIRPSLDLDATRNPLNYLLTIEVTDGERSTDALFRIYVIKNNTKAPEFSYEERDVSESLAVGSEIIVYTAFDPDQPPYGIVSYEIQMGTSLLILFFKK